MSEPKKLQFTLGDGFGKLLTDTAIEKMYYDLDIQGAKKFLKDSLPGIPDSLVIDILLFKKVAVTAGDFDVDVVDKLDIHSYYLGIDLIQFYVDNYKRYNNKALELNRDLASFIKGMNGTDIVYEFVTDEIIVSKDDLIEQAFICNDEVSFLKQVKRKSSREFKASMPEKFYLLIQEIKKFLEKSNGVMAVFDLINTKFKEEIKSAQFEHGFRGLIPSEIIDLHGAVNMIKSGNMDSVSYKGKESDDLVDTYIKSQQEIDNITSKGIEPVDILNGYNAGYLSQDGVFYGMNGTIANMIHIQIGDALFEKGLISPHYKNRIDSFFEENGYAKIHGNRILYAGYDLHVRGIAVIPMSLKQQKIIAEYIEKIHSGVLEVDNLKELNVLIFKRTEQPMLRKYFSQIHMPI
jgi:hypothetical protein